jgi:anti-sigma-K factor RskA
LGGAVALALLIFLFIFNLSLRNRLINQQIEVSSLKEEITHQTKIIEFLQNPNVVVINLVGLKPDPQAHGKMLWDKKHNKALFYGLNLPPVPSGKTYQLWVIADNIPVSMGIFKVDEKGTNIMQLENIPSKAQKFAATLEPDGGVPQPTGEMYLIGAS